MESNCVYLNRMNSFNLNFPPPSLSVVIDVMNHKVRVDCACRGVTLGCSQLIVNWSRAGASEWPVRVNFPMLVLFGIDRSSALLVPRGPPYRRVEGNPQLETKRRPEPKEEGALLLPSVAQY